MTKDCLPNDRRPDIYEGHEFRTFSAIPGDSLSLSDNQTRAFYRDSENNMWIGTNNRVLHKYWREPVNFLPF